MNLLYKSYILEVTHTRNIRYEQYFIGSCFDISFIEYHFDDVKKLFVRLVDDYTKDYSIPDCEIESKDKKYEFKIRSLVR